MARDPDRIMRVYILEADEKPLMSAMQDADLVIQFTNNTGMYRDTLCTEARMRKNRWGPTGPVEIIENPGK